MHSSGRGTYVSVWIRWEPRIMVMVKMSVAGVRFAEILHQFACEQWLKIHTETNDKLSNCKLRIKSKQRPKPQQYFSIFALSSSSKSLDFVANNIHGTLTRWQLLIAISFSILGMNVVTLQWIFDRILWHGITICFLFGEITNDWCWNIEIQMTRERMEKY